MLKSIVENLKTAYEFEMKADKIFSEAYDKEALLEARKEASNFRQKACYKFLVELENAGIPGEEISRFCGMLSFESDDY